MSNSIQITAVRQTLSLIKDPTLNQDIVTLGWVKNLQIEGGMIKFTLAGKSPRLAQVKHEAEEALMKIEGVNAVQITVQGAASAKGGLSIDGVKHIIAVSSGKGGVGKSTTAVNFAIALAQSGAKVGLMDADLYGPNLPLMMGVTDSPKLVQDPVKGDLFIPPVAYGVKVFSMGFLSPGDQPMIWRGPMLHNVLTQFCRNVDWSGVDILVVDMPPGTGDIQLSLAQLVPISGAIVVTTPQEVALQDVRKAVNMWEKVRVPIFGVVENMSYFRCDHCDEKHELFGSGGGARLGEKFGLKLLAQVPLVQGIREGGDIGKPMCVVQPKSETSQIYLNLAKQVLNALENDAKGSADVSSQIEIGSFH